jgi:muramoyltetrapeptide carboxypeptidase
MPVLTPIYPPKLHRGDTVRVVAPSRSRGLVLEHDHSELIETRFRGLGLGLTFGEHVDERDDFDLASIGSQVADLHAAFADPSVHGILTVIGGFNCNELLPHLDWDLIGQSPKVFCGYSDITALHNAILARSGLVTSAASNKPAA